MNSGDTVVVKEIGKQGILTRKLEGEYDWMVKFYYQDRCHNCHNTMIGHSYQLPYKEKELHKLKGRI